MTTLVSFLGRGREDSTKGYRTATYCFPDGQRNTTAYFGLALAQWLDAQRLILLGTDSSMWDVLIENLATEGDDEALRLELMDAVVQARVTDELLARVAPMVARAVGRPCELHVISHARDAAGQQAILARLSELVKPKERIALDLTHGYRHLAMLGLEAAGFLEATRRVEIVGLYYGALDMTKNGETPVLRLDGLAHIRAWTEALARFDASGNYGVFAPLLERDGLGKDKAQCLVEAAFHETTTQVALAAQKLQTVLTALQQTALSGASELFRSKLIERLDWARKDNLADQQRTLALRALDRGDFLRACIFGIEALITRRCLEEKRDPKDYAEREAVDKAFQQQIKSDQHPDWLREAYWTLRNLRNAMAHGTSPDWKRQRQLLADRERLEKELRAHINRLTNT